MKVIRYVAAVAVALVCLGPRMGIQVPPNLSRPNRVARLVHAVELGCGRHTVASLLRITTRLLELEVTG
jgi:hypothetical protein